MELWIRSQDGSQLISTSDIFVRKYSTGENNTKYKITCIENKLYRGWCNLGVYETKERALEVLDEIQDLIKPRIITTSYECEIKDSNKLNFELEMTPQKTEIQELSTVVYEMPKE